MTPPVGRQRIVNRSSTATKVNGDPIECLPRKSCRGSTHVKSVSPLPLSGRCFWIQMSNYAAHTFLSRTETLPTRGTKGQHTACVASRLDRTTLCAARDYLRREKTFWTTPTLQSPSGSDCERPIRASASPRDSCGTDASSKSSTRRLGAAVTSSPTRGDAWPPP